MSVFLLFLFSKDPTVSVWLDNSQVTFTTGYLFQEAHFQVPKYVQQQVIWKVQPLGWWKHRLATAAGSLPPAAITAAGTLGWFSVGWKDKKEHVEKQQRESYVPNSEISGWLMRFSP